MEKEAKHDLSSKANKKKEILKKPLKKKIEKNIITNKKDIKNSSNNEIKKVYERKVNKEASSSTSSKNAYLPSNEDIKNLESIKDAIKRITGDNYGIYKELFFKSVRISIRHILEVSHKKKISFFSDEENKAEDIIFEYIENNYENPYQNWLLSKHKKEVEDLGFHIHSIDEVIKDWVYYNKL